MKLFEYQAKSFFQSYSIPTERFIRCDDIEESLDAYKKLDVPIVVLKAQVHTGGRGKAGGIQLATSNIEVVEKAENIFDLILNGYPVKEIIVSEAIAIQSEYYVSLVIDRSIKKVLLVLSRQGGMEIEKIANKTPEKVLKYPIDSLIGIPYYLARYYASKLFIDNNQQKKFTTIIQRLYELFVKEDASLVEINPLASTSTGDLIAIDGKIVLDNNATYRHPEHESLYQYSKEELIEKEAKEKGFSYISLDGNIGCLVNGAGLAMSTMDRLIDFGGSPANFLDIGGSSSPEKVRKAMELLLSDKKVKVVLINIFGGITRCDDVANGVLSAFEIIRTELPIVVRLTGTNEKEGRYLLKKNSFIGVDSMDEAIKRAVELSKK